MTYSHVQVRGKIFDKPPRDIDTPSFDVTHATHVGRRRCVRIKRAEEMLQMLLRAKSRCGEYIIYFQRRRDIADVLLPPLSLARSFFAKYQQLFGLRSIGNHHFSEE